MTEFTCFKKSKTEDKELTKTNLLCCHTAADKECRQVSKGDTQGPGLIRVRKGGKTEEWKRGKTHQDHPETGNTEYY